MTITFSLLVLVWSKAKMPNYTKKELITSLLKTNANIDLPFRNNYRIIENHFHYSDLETIAVLFEINFCIDFWVRNK